MYQLFSDGMCKPNPGPGAWAYVIKRDGLMVFEATGVDPVTTSNRMELQAVIAGLTVLPPDEAVTLFADSQYLVSGLNRWRPRWKQYSWQGVKNGDLWQALDRLTTGRELTAIWVRGHHGHPENELCDRMAGEAYDHEYSL
jgi:ribonuclease HI